MSFVKFTLGDIRTAVRRKLDDTTFDTATIDEAANDFQFELFNDNRIRFMEKNASLSITTNATSVSLPSDFMNLINFIVFDDSSTPRNITKTGYLNYDEFMERYANYLVASTSKVYDWTFFGEGIRFQAPSDGNYTSYIDYIRSPAVMSEADDECELPINARELMTLGTLERVMRVNEDFNEADFEMSRLESLRTAFVRNYGRGGERVGPQIIKTNRNRVTGGYRADRDFG